jgi:3',5'-cyclic AMP phosphodiesterase CpdA
VRTIVHISDLHFDHVDAEVLPRLTETIRAARPDVVVVSGDLTQRARAYQFAAARAFLDSLPRPQIVVPGNHDVPLYNVAARFLNPLDNYKRHITGDLEPFYRDTEIAVLGINTARSLAFKNGRINEQQVARSCMQLEPLSSGIVRVVVTHHPFALPDDSGDSPVGRAAMAIESFAACKVDLILSGHLHASHATHGIDHYDSIDHSPLLVQAGTATSVRKRNEDNSFNILRIERPRVTVDRLTWDEGREDFALAESNTFALSNGAASKARP